ncbi:hypothetical protein B0H10DRAFT_1946658 [Mycena sp. CBHHK59/15]|nr:hypothetical protein B0H10DRAFT_1946658 [Mycena sp. CBHHK59/15]
MSSGDVYETTGDFDQLPPVSGHAYDSKISLRTTEKMTPQMQSAVLGRILWHQFTTVVLLRQNMRQKEQTELDAKLRTALENMRYGACTDDDIEFLGTRTASDRPGHPHLDIKKYRNVSVITGLNIHKDLINDEGVRQFARDTGQELIEFYSIDKLSSQVVDRHNSLLSLTWEQVMVLPNFATTDYASQGKSRNPNVVHLNNSKNHHNYYVALSQGYTAEGTAIIQGFDPKKITSGISGHLRQEFRELELLDEITRLRYENQEE